MSEAVSLAGALERALAEAAGGDGRAVSRATAAMGRGSDYGAGGDATDASVSARVDRATRSLVFVHGEAVLADGRRAASASGVFRVRTT